jgi:hypothetical protein
MKRLITAAIAAALLASGTAAQADQANIWGDPNKPDESYRYKVTTLCEGNGSGTSSLLDADAEQHAISACKAYPEIWCTVTAVKIEDRVAGTESVTDCDDIST